VIMLLLVSYTPVLAVVPGVVNATQLNLRSGPGTAYKVISVLPKNTALIITDQSGEWKKVLTAKGQTGWVNGQFVAVDLQFKESTGNIRVDVPVLNVRQGPATNYPVIGTLTQDKQVTFNGETTEWYRIDFSGKIGFVNKEFVKLNHIDNKVANVATGLPVNRVAVNRLNMRAGAGTQFPIITQLNEGDFVGVLERGEWSKVVLVNGIVGYCFSEYLIATNNTVSGIITSAKVNQRSGPSLNHEIMAVISEGEIFTVVGVNGSWIQISSSAGVGYVLSSLITMSFSVAKSSNGSSSEIIVEPLVPEIVAPEKELVGRVVHLDAGHGGNDPGAIGINGLYEKNINLIIALKLKQLLENEGATVYMTRSTDIFHILDDRVAMANSFGAELVVSIHNNSHPSSSVSGTQTFYGVTEGSLSLGWAIHQQLVALGLVDRGLLTATFKVLRLTVIPAVLTETAFLSNRGDAELLSQPIFLDSVAEAHFKGIKTWLLNKKKAA
ncbi:MAG: SH3 domain-containing protein, partial [bacterium]|nr:SH3 domain-containing protein [bacterium]